MKNLIKKLVFKISRLIVFFKVKTPYDLFVKEEVRDSYLNFKKHFYTSIFFENSYQIREYAIKKSLNYYEQGDLNLEFGFGAGKSLNIFSKILVDKKITAFGDGFLGKLINKAVGSPDAEAPLSIPTSSSGVDGGLAAAAAGRGMSTPPRTTGASVAQSVTAMSPGAMGGSAPSVVNAPTTMAIGSSQTTYAGGGVSTTDPRRPSFTSGTSY